MSIFAQAARTIAALAGLGSDFAGAGLPSGSFSAKDLAGTISSATGDLGALTANLGHDTFWRQGSQLLSAEKKSDMLARLGGYKKGPKGIDRYGRAVDVILWSITVVEALELTTGFGQPDEGDDVRVGSELFAALSRDLALGLPDDNWQGTASQAYANLNTELQNITQALAAIDTQLATPIKDQAEWVTHMRLGFGILKDVLLGAYLIEVAMMLGVPFPVGPAKAKVFAYTAAGLGIGAAVSFLATLMTFSDENRAKADGATEQYLQLTTALTQAATQPATVEQPGVSRLETASSNVTEFSTFPEERPITSLALAANGSETLPAVPTAVTAQVDSAEDTAPAATMPTLDQLTVLSGQTARLSGQLSQPINLVNQVMGQVQQLATLAQQNQEEPAAEPADREDDSAGPSDVDNTPVAGPSTVGAERAPVEISAPDEANPVLKGL